MLTLLSAVGLCEALQRVAGVEAKIKWPNDILIHNKKVAGILTELNAEMDATRFVIIGFGINVNTEKDALVAGATSLKEQTKAHLNRTELLREVLRRIEAHYLTFQKEGSGPVLQAWRQYAITLGKRVKVFSHKEHLEGEAVEVDNDGGLIVRSDSGLMKKVTSGDIVHCR
jgi:BirA family biotin operon repressor/biotin-[acetyl-CoA-carboxylase] ligase